MASVGERATYRQAVAAVCIDLLTPPSFQYPLNRPNPAHQLFQFSLGMPIRLEDWPGGFIQIVIVTQLMWHIGETAGHCLADGLLPIRTHPATRNSKGLVSHIHEVGEAPPFITAMRPV